MIAELLKTYHGVCCHRCNEPIPVSGKIAKLQNQFQDYESNEPRTFAARCKLCEYESIYRVNELQEFEGQPKKRPRPKARAAGA